MDCPGFDTALGISEINVPMLVQACISELAVEAVHQGVLNRLAKLDECSVTPVRIEHRNKALQV